MRRLFLILSALAQPTAAPAAPLDRTPPQALPAFPGRFQIAPSAAPQGQAQAAAVILDSATGRAWLLLVPGTGGAPALVPVPYARDPLTVPPGQSLTPPAP